MISTEESQFAISLAVFVGLRNSFGLDKMVRAKGKVIDGWEEQMQKLAPTLQTGQRFRVNIVVKFNAVEKSIATGERIYSMSPF